MPAVMTIPEPAGTFEAQKAVQQLAQEGTVQIFIDPLVGAQDPILGVVGELQFEVIQYRLLHEYSASVQFNNLSFFKACWLTSTDQKKLDDFARFKQNNIAEDKDGQMVYLAQSEWFLNTEISNNPDIHFHYTSEIHKD